MSKTSPSETYGTISHFKKYRWKDLNKRTVNGIQRVRLLRKNNASYLRKGVELRISKDEFYAFCDRNKDLIMSIYEMGDVPSIDRVDSAAHYELANMRILPLSQNRPNRRLLE